MIIHEIGVVYANRRGMKEVDLWRLKSAGGIGNLYGVEVELDGVTLLLAYSQRLVGVYDQLPDVSTDPALLVHSFGARKTA